MLISDLAVEFSKSLKRNKDYDKIVEKINERITKTTINIKTDEMSEKYRRQKGFYILLEIPFWPILVSLEKDKLIKELSNCIKQVIAKCNIKKPKSALIVGLGNEKMTADCFGAKVSEKILVTRHALKSGMKNKLLCEVSSFNTSVFGLTGIESYDLIKGAVSSIEPEIVIVIDTLVAENYKRLCNNIQIANVGIVPGSGVKNSRKEISQKTLNVPVITIGIPFVVYASSLVNQIANKNKISVSKNSFNQLDSLVMMPREIDEQIRFCSRIVASAINNALNDEKLQRDLETFL